MSTEALRPQQVSEFQEWPEAKESEFIITFVVLLFLFCFGFLPVCSRGFVVVELVCLF